MKLFIFPETFFFLRFRWNLFLLRFWQKFFFSYIKDETYFFYFFDKTFFLRFWRNFFCYTFLTKLVFLTVLSKVIFLAKLYLANIIWRNFFGVDWLCQSIPLLRKGLTLATLVVLIFFKWLDRKTYIHTHAQLYITSWLKLAKGRFNQQWPCGFATYDISCANDQFGFSKFILQELSLCFFAEIF